MPSQFSAAEIVFFPQRQNISHATALEKLASSKSSWRAHSGFKGAYFGPCIEDRRISCLILEWADREALIKWTGNYNAEAVDKMKVEMVDSEAGLEPFATFITFAHDPHPALDATVTEFGFFSLPDGIANQTTVFEKCIGDADMNQHPVMTVGKAKGAATGHVFAVKPEMAAEGMTTAFAGVFGYDSVEDHRKWRDTPEHAEVIKGMDSMVKDLGLKAVDVLGKRRAFIEGTGILHVEFEKIA